MPEADGVGEGLVAGGGARGTDGVVGASFLAKCRGRAMRATAAQVTPAPAAARTQAAADRGAADRLVAAGGWAEVVGGGPQDDGEWIVGLEVRAARQGV